MLSVDFTAAAVPTSPAIVWGTTVNCGIAWTGECNGIDAPWGLFPMKAYTAGASGEQRAWKWLANNTASKSSIFSVEAGDKLNILAYEFIDKTDNAGAWNPEKVRWAGFQYTVTGAHSRAVTAAVAAGALLLSFF